MALGSLMNGGSAGYLELVDAGVAADLSPIFSPAALAYESTAPEIYVHRQDGILRQIIANQVVADIVVPSGTTDTFEIRCFSPTQIQTYVPCTFSGDPFVVYRVERGAADSGDPTAVEVKITRTTRNIPDPNATNVPVARTDVMTFRRAGVAPGYIWSRTDWTLAGQAALASVTARPPTGAPVLVTRPSSKSAPVGSEVVLKVAAVGYPVPTYEWRKNGSGTVLGTGPKFTFGSLQTSDAGTYSVTATNAQGSVSASASIVVATPGAVPVITSHPATQASAPGRIVVLEVAAAGTAPLTYQWKKNGTNISGATSSILTLGNAQSTDAGDYTVTVTNGSGSATSDAATLSLLSARTEERTVETPGGPTALKVARTYTAGTTGEELTQETVGTSSPTSTDFEYYDDITKPGSFGFLKSVKLPGGGWESYDYYETTQSHGYQVGQIRIRFRPFGSSPTIAGQDPSQGETTHYDYDTDAHGARTRLARVRTFVRGFETSRVTNDYEYVAGDYLTPPSVKVTKREFVNGSQSLTTLSGNHLENNSDAFLRGKLLYEVGPDLVQRNVVYQRGSWDGSAFTLGGAPSLCSRISVVTGVDTSVLGAGISSSNGYLGSTMKQIHLIAAKSTAEGVVRDERGLVVRKESLVWTGSAWQVISYENMAYNFAGLLISKVSSTGATYTATYDGLLKTSETNPDGTTVGFLYDAAGRVSLTTVAGSGSIASLSTRTTYNSLGQSIEERTGIGHSEQLVTTRTYDLAGRLVSETAPGVAASTRAYDVANRKVTTTRPDGSTVIEQSNIDGRPLSRTGSGVVAEFFSYDFDPASSRHWSQTNRGMANSRRWMRTYKDWLGREVASVTPVTGALATTFDGNFASSAVFVKQSTYHATTGRLASVAETDKATVSFEYDAMATRKRSTLPTSGDSRIEEVESMFEQHGGAWWASQIKRAFITAGATNPVSLSTERKRLTDFPVNRIAETVSIDTPGNLTTVSTDVNRVSATVTTTTTTTGITRPSLSVAVAGLKVRDVDTAGTETTYTYDPLRRRITLRDGRNNTTTTAYVAGTSLVSSVTDATSTIVALYAYDSMGRKVSQAGAPDVAVSGSPRHYTYWSYDLRGNIVREWGGATIPVSYGFDATFGEKTTMSTYRGGSGWDGSTWPSSPGTADTTTWTFDASSGLLLGKTDAAGRSVAYSYNRRGQMATRTWARGVATVYSYDSATTDQKEISYSDGTPTLRYSYDRMGRAVTIEDATGTRTMEYCTCGKLAKEHLSADFFGGRKLEYKLSWAAGSVLGRTIGYTLSSGGTLEQDITFGHDGLSGRLETITTASTFAAAGHVFRYAYLANSSIVQSLSVDGGNNPFTVTRSFETNRDVLTSIETKWSTTSRARFEYTVDKLGQRSSMVRSGDVYADYWDGSHTSLLDTFAYDSKGQLTAANTYRGGSVDANKVFHDRQHAYSYDNIGNRNYSSSRTSDAGLRDNYNVLSDSNNSTEVAARDRKMKLNQIHTRENNLLNVSGTAHVDAKVEVSGRNVLAARQGRYWNDALTVGNVLRPWRGPLTIFAAQQNGGPGGTTDLVRTDVRLAQLPQALQTFEYDDDGNLTTDGVWDYLWDAENRIVRMTTTALAVQGGYPNRRLEFKYDYLGRRVLKRVSDHGSNQLVSAARFVYEGWNMIGEYTDTGATLPGAIKRSYTWGLDIVHTREKAGGVGALLQIADYVGSKGYFPAYDGNGNVVALFDGAPSGGSAGTRVAAYEYSPFGELLRSEGGYAADNPVRFSTKVTDDESGLVYYGRRYYSPGLGRFLGRDPIDEAGGPNLYGFVGNNPINRWDLLGMFDWFYTGPDGTIHHTFPHITDSPGNFLTADRDAALIQASNTPGSAPLYNDWADSLQAQMFDLFVAESSSGSMVTDAGVRVAFDVKVGPLLTEDHPAWIDPNFASYVTALIAEGTDNRLASATPSGRMPTPSGPAPGPSLGGRGPFGLGRPPVPTSPGPAPRDLAIGPVGGAQPPPPTINITIPSNVPGVWTVVAMVRSPNGWVPLYAPPGGSAGMVRGDVHSYYPNNSNAMRINPNGHPNNPTPHAHLHLPGTGPFTRGQGPSLSPTGAIVPWNSPLAHWPLPPPPAPTAPASPLPTP